MSGARGGGGGRSPLLLAVVVAMATWAPDAFAQDAPGKAVAFDNRLLEPYFRQGALRGAIERFRLEEWRPAADGLTRALAGLRRSSTERQPARFMLALAHMNLGEWHTAGRIFEDLYAGYPVLGRYHAFYAARCRLRQGDAAGALDWVNKVPERSVPEAEAVLVRIDALAAQKRWAEVEAVASGFLDRFVAGPRRAEASFRRAEALERLGRPAADVAPHYRKIWAEAPGEIWAARSADRLEALAAAAPDADETARLRGRTAGEHATRAMVLFDRNQNAESEAAFVAAISAPGLDPPLACKAQYHRAQSVWKQRQRTRAAPLFTQAEAACRTAGDADLLVKALYQGARCAASMGDRAGALARYARIETDHPSHSYADDARLRAAEVAVDMGDDAAADALLKEIPERYPQGDLLGEALWRLAFRAWRAGKWDEARAWLDENLRRIPRESIWYAEGRAHYWLARILERQGAADEARQAYERAAREYPLSVYALLAVERMRSSFPERRAALLTDLGMASKGAITPDVPWKFAPQPLFGDPDFQRAVELARLGLGPDARRELARLGLPTGEKGPPAGTLGDDRRDVYWIAAVLLDRGRLWSASHGIPRYTVTDYRLDYPAGAGRQRWRIAYPRAYPELVAKSSRENQVPEALQLAIMREESAFSPGVESWANALGLTQMLVRTAQRFATTKVTRETLLDPPKNVALGSRFLGFLVRRYGGAAPLAIAGYNAGEAAVDRWLRERGDLELDEFLETIPYDETRNYTKRVLASYFAYSWLYFPDSAVPEIAFELRPPGVPRAGRAAPPRR